MARRRFHDAVIAALEHLQEASHQKRVLVVLSDGDDNASQHSSDVMLERAARSDALIYTVSTADLDTSVGKPRLLKKLAELSGGAAYTPDSDEDVVDAFMSNRGKHPPRLQHRIRADQHVTRRPVPAGEGNRPRARLQEPQCECTRWLPGAP